MDIRDSVQAMQMIMSGLYCFAIGTRKTKNGNAMDALPFFGSPERSSDGTRLSYSGTVRQLAIFQ